MSLLTHDILDFAGEINDLSRRREPYLFLIDYEMRRPILYPLSRLPKGVYYNFGGRTNDDRLQTSLGGFDFDKYPMSFEEYRIGFDKVHASLKRGDSFLLNLSYRTPIRSLLTFGQIFQHSIAKYKLQIGEEAVVFSPETFVKVIDGYIYSYPMKGTIDANIKNAKEIILADKKETAEHNTIVDLIRNDLSMSARQVTVTKYRYIDHLKTHDKSIYQVSSEIRGKLSDDYLDHLGDLLIKMLPAGSICGAPKPKTCEIIKDAEHGPRGYYTGIAGLFDGRSLDTCVMIRFVEREGDQLYYRSGGGITHMSDAWEEYKEMIDKVYVPIYRDN